MPSREHLIAQACSLNVNYTLAKYANDSVLEQAVKYAQVNLAASGAATTIVVPAAVKYGLAGGKNV